ncbi:MAG: hypothetical protein LBG15_06510 [Dysgonamonadaceae bacterium]|jgi:hypothetical protein|nr:hypothetical protein [Dysgonamonadaceae bacterium]
METKLTEQQSLEVISEMINRARNNIQKGSANSLIYNGCAVALVAVANFILLHVLAETKLNLSFSVWFLMIPSAVIDYFLKRKIDCSAIVKTEIDAIVRRIWNSFSITVALLIAALFAVSVASDKYNYTLLITPSIMLMVAMAESIMAKVCRYKPFFRGAVYFWIGAILCIFTYCVLKRGDIQFLILAVCMILGFVIPGYKLNKLAENNHV